MARYFRSWIAGIALLGVAVLTYMLVQSKEGSWSLQEEIAQTDLELMRERQTKI